MSDAAQRIGTMVAALLEDLDCEYGPAYNVADAVIAVEVMPPSDEIEQGAGSIFEHRATTHRTSIAVGIVRATQQSLLSGYVRGEEDNEGDE